jgi:5'-3' exonuclease
MGIKHFFRWMKFKFINSINRLKSGDTFKENGIHIDNLFIDMNGLFHTSAQKIYQYGNYKPLPRLLGKQNPPNIGGLQKQLDVFRHVCESIDKIMNIIQPKKRLILAVDGSAPICKATQQRSRRFLASKNKEKNTHSFDSNCISPGTKFMDHLTKYIDWYIRKRISTDQEDSIWKNIEVTFSNEKVPGEGESKLLNFIRKFGVKEESYCIHGMDADLIMLALGSHMPNFWILREEPMTTSFEYYAIDIGSLRDELSEEMKWKDGKPFDKEKALNDFVLLCFTVGNDFLSHLPAIEIIEGGIEYLIDTYRNVCKDYGHLTRLKDGSAVFRRKSLSVFFGTLSQYEQTVLQNKLLHKDKFFTDDILEKNSEFVDGKYNVNIKQYRKDYYSTLLPGVNKETICNDYLEGMNFVLTYYLCGLPSWRWRYKYHYAPFIFDLAKYTKEFTFSSLEKLQPPVPFVQLLAILPPGSSKLLPSPLNSLLKTEDSPLSEFIPKEVEIDLAGKRQEWEAVVLLPFMDYEIVEKEYSNLIKNVEDTEKRRNILGKNFVYVKTNESYPFQSYYGNFQCCVNTKVVEF